MKYASFNVHAWIKGCRGLTAEQEGHYIRICMAVYDNDGPIEYNSNKLRLTLGCKGVKKTERVISELINMSLIFEKAGFISNEKCDEVLFKAHTKSKILSQKAIEREKVKNAIIGNNPLKTVNPDQLYTSSIPALYQLAATNEKEKEKEKYITTTVVSSKNALTPTSVGDVNLIKNEFTKIWAAYPRKVSKQASLKAYQKARKKHSYSDIANPLRVFIDATNADGDPSSMIHLATWINSERFDPEEDQIAAVNGKTKKAFTNGQSGNQTIETWAERAINGSLDKPPAD